MKDKEEIKIAWEIWNLMSRLNDLLWDFYEEDFANILRKKYRTPQTDENNLSD